MSATGASSSRFSRSSGRSTTRIRSNNAWCPSQNRPMTANPSRALNRCGTCARRASASAALPSPSGTARSRVSRVKAALQVHRGEGVEARPRAGQIRPRGHQVRGGRAGQVGLCDGEQRGQHEPAAGRLPGQRDLLGLGEQPAVAVRRGMHVRRERVLRSERVVQRQHPDTRGEGQVPGELAPRVHRGDHVPAAEEVQQGLVRGGCGRDRPQPADRMLVADLVERDALGLRHGVHVPVGDPLGRGRQVLGVLARRALVGERQLGHPGCLAEHVRELLGLGARHRPLRSSSCRCARPDRPTRYPTVGAECVRRTSAT